MPETPKIDRHMRIADHVIERAFDEQQRANLHCLVGYYGTLAGVGFAVFVATDHRGNREFGFGTPAVPEAAFTSDVVRPDLVAAVRAYGFKDGFPPGDQGDLES